MLNAVILPELREGFVSDITLVVIIVMLQGHGCTPVVTLSSSTPLPENAKVTGLEWRPTLPMDELDIEPLDVYHSISVTLLSVEDVRENQAVIGKTFEDMKVRDSSIPVATKANVARWCKRGLLDTFKKFNIPTVEKKGNLLLEIEITGLSINDDITQTGTAAFRISAKNGEEMLIWEGQIQGTSDLYIRPKDSNGISECLSNTLKVTLNNVLIEKSFRDAVIKTFDL